MEPNQNDKNDQLLEKKINQPRPLEVKTEEKNADSPVAKTSEQEKNVQIVRPVSTDIKKIGDVPDINKKPETETIKAEITGEAAPVEKKRA